MIRLEQGTNTNTFKINNVDYLRGVHEIFYSNTIIDSSGNINYEKLEIGLINKHTRVFIQEPDHYFNWTNATNTPYASYSSLVNDLVQYLVPLNTSVDDVLEFANFASLPATGQTGKIYITLDDSKTYLWNGTSYIETSQSSIPNLQQVTDIGSNTTNPITVVATDPLSLGIASVSASSDNGIGIGGDSLNGTAIFANSQNGVASRFNIGNTSTFNISEWYKDNTLKSFINGDGDIKIRSILDNTDSIGTSGQILSSTGSGVDWVDPSSLPSNPNNWSLLGNSGTNPATNFIGTTDAQPLIFKVNNLRSGYIHPIEKNTFLGTSTGINHTTGIQSTGFGFESLKSQTTANNNTAFGNQALTNATTGGSNIAFGNASLFSLTTGFDNCAGGNGALFNTTTGVQNVGFGKGTLNNNLTGNSNTAVGHGALLVVLNNNNVGVGANAGNTITTGTGNIAIGFNSQVPSATSNNQISLGNFLYKLSTGESGVGTNAPTKTWDINGELRVRTLPTGLSTENILVANANGDIRSVNPNSRFIDKEIPTGLINGSNTVFTLTNTPVSGSEHVYRNGLLQEVGVGNDYIISGSTITFVTAPLTGDKIVVTYRI